MIALPTICPEFIGRRAELDALTAAQRASARGRGAFVLVSGDAGIGKTRLVREFCGRLSNGRAAVGIGGYEEFGGLPYAGLVEAMRRIGIDERPSAQRTLAEQQAAFVAALSAAAARRNVVLVLENAHWADDATFAFLLHARRIVASQRLLVVITFRSDDVRAPQLPLIARLARDTSTVHAALAPLPADETAQLVRAIVAGADAGNVGAHVDDIVRRSEGNPLFAEELVKSAYAAGGDATTLPFTVRAAIAERTALLTPDERAVLSTAAVFGRQFAVDLLAELLAADPAAVFAALRRARDLQLVEERASDGTFAFRHALTRDAIYADLFLSEARPLHRRILAALERRASDAAELGYHAWAAGETDAAIACNEAAGDAALALHAYVDARVAYERALDRVTDESVRGRLLEKTARCASQAGKPDDAARLLGAALGAYECAGRADRLAEIYHRQSAEAHMAGDEYASLAALREGMARLPIGSPWRATLQLAELFARLHLGETDAVGAQLSQTRPALDDPAAATLYHKIAIGVMARLGDVEGTRAAVRPSIAAEAGDLEGELRARYNAGYLLGAVGCDDEALVYLDAVAVAARERRMPLYEAMSCAVAATLHARSGRLARAREAVERALALPESVPLARVAIAASALTVAALGGAEFAGLDVRVRAAAEASRRAGFPHTALGRFVGPYARWLAADGNGAAAEAVLAETLATLRTPFEAGETLLAAAELGGPDIRRAAAALLADAPATSIGAAIAAHVRAHVALRDGHAGAGSALARDAAERYRAGGWFVLAANADELAGDATRATAAYLAMGAAGALRAMSAGRRPQSRPHGLSPREWEVAARAGAGASNRAIAAELAVSEKTVEKHLGSAYAKLGLRNRAELAAFIAAGRSAERTLG